jgi:glycosyltransferase involved in cell wall biosynthesis
MNILCLPHAFWPDYTGGVVKSVLTEIEGLAAMGHHVVVASKRLHPDHPEYEARDGYELYRYARPSMGTLLRQTSPLLRFSVPPELVDMLHHRYDFDVAYVHNISPMIGLRMALCLIPAVYVYHASAHREIALDLKYGRYGARTWFVHLGNNWVKNVEEITLGEAETIVFRSRFMQNDMAQLYGDMAKNKMRLLPLCVDTDKYKFAENSRGAREELELPLDRPVLLTIRRLVGRMGLENLIGAMRSVVEQFSDVLLLIVGKGYLEKKLRALISQLNLERNISMLGFVPEESLARYYQAADLFVMPTSAYEGFGLSTIEALSCGTPVMATPVGANREIVGLLGNEFLFADETAHAMSVGIKSFLSKSPDSAMRARCRRFCVEHFDRGKVCEDLAGILSEAAALK